MSTDYLDPKKYVKQWPKNCEKSTSNYSTCCWGPEKSHEPPSSAPHSCPAVRHELGAGLDGLPPPVRARLLRAPDALNIGELCGLFGWLQEATKKAQTAQDKKKHKELVCMFHVLLKVRVSPWYSREANHFANLNSVGRAARAAEVVGRGG